MLLDTELLAPQRQLLKSVERSADSLLAVINDILDFSKIEAGKMTIEEAPFDLKTVIEDSIEVMKFAAISKKIEIEVDYGTRVGLGVIGDSVRVRQILLNLLSNAVKQDCFALPRTNL